MMDIALKIENEKKEMRAAFCESLIELAREDERIVLLDADLMGAMGTKPFQDMFPVRTIDCGIQEANMVGVAAGMSVSGLVPFAHSFGTFISRRVADQVFVSAAYAKLNVKLIGSDPGITAMNNGGTHMPFEDMGIMRGIPEVTVIEPTDVVMLKEVVRQMAGTYGVQYMRLVRKQCKKIYAEGTEFTIGKAKTLKEGTDVTIIASGYCVTEALVAARNMEHRGISARVVDMFTWKPLDELCVLAAARETGAIVTCENHNVKTGLGAAVSEVVVRNHPVVMEFVGVQDRFGQVGDLDFLADAYQINAEAIEKAVQNVLERKLTDDETH